MTAYSRRMTSYTHQTVEADTAMQNRRYKLHAKSFTWPGIIQYRVFIYIH